MVPAAAAAPVTPPTAVLRLANAVTAEEVDDDDEYEEILEDMREECNKCDCTRGAQPHMCAGWLLWLYYLISWCRFNF